jgi:hypothetical protein
MSDLQRRCPRCRGQKSIFKIGRSGYTLENFGGEKVDCPSCAGKGYVTIPDFVQEAKKKQEELTEIKVKRTRKRKLLDDGTEKTESETEKTE